MLASLTLVLAAVGATALHQPAANSDVSLITCTAMALHGDFSPGIDDEVRDINANGNGTATGCLSPTQPTITRASGTVNSADGSASCAPNGGSGSWSDDVSVTWKNTAGGTVGTSVISGTFSYTVDLTGGITGSASGSVSSGLFSNGTVVPLITGVAADLSDCLSGGVTEGTATGSFAIVSAP
ncbi:hypothetical protein [Actinomadura sp. 9N215]|uniref:hypothetical protein n=1 Tax=Actinomadura sp. 9N215 TaxID=3375150 RepID=UPI0037B030CA